MSFKLSLTNGSSEYLLDNFILFWRSKEKYQEMARYLPYENDAIAIFILSVKLYQGFD